MEQTARDLELIRERVHRLSGADGVERLEAALNETSNRVAQEVMEGQGSASSDGNGADSESRWGSWLHVARCRPQG